MMDTDQSTPIADSGPPQNVPEDDDATKSYDFRFVEVGEPSQAGDGQSRSAVRSHVMRDFYEKRKQRRRPSGPPPPPLPEEVATASQKEGAVKATHRFKMGPQGLQEMKKGKSKRRNAPPVTVQNARASTSRTSQEKQPAQPDLCQAETVNNSTGGVVAAEVTQPPGVSEGQIFGAEIAEKGKWLTRDMQRPGVDTRPPGESPSWDLMQIQEVPARLQTGLIDPFSCLPFSHSPRIQALLHHANQSIFASQLTGQLRTEWLSLATQDSALFHVALTHYSGNLGLTHHSLDPVEALRFRMEAIEIINERLESTESATTDGNIGAVASLGSYEATNGHRAAINTHITGLKRLITLRGGIDKAELNQYTRRLVLWADLQAATALGYDPLPVAEFDQEGAESTVLPETSHAEQGGTMTLLERGSRTTKDSQAVGRDLIDRLTELRTLLRVDSTANGRPTMSLKEKIGQSDRLYRTERGLVLLANKSGPRKFLTCCCHAALLFSHNHLRGIRFNARIIDRTVTRIQISMEHVLGSASVPSLSTNTRRAMIWVLWVGAVANVAGHWQDKECFYQALVQLCDVTNLQTWEDVQSVLRGFLWTPDWDKDGRAVWDRLDALRWTTFATFPEVPVT